MEATASIPARLSRGLAVRIDLAAVGAWLLPFLLVLFLALNNGGYDVTDRSQAGIIVWWIVLVGTAVGVLPAAGGTRAGRVMLGLLAAFAGWTALSLGWTESAERTSIELGRVAAYLGFFAVALAVQGEGRWRHLLHGVTAGVALVAGIAVLSRLEPTWFPKRVTGEFLPGIEIERRLAYPLNYSSGLGALAAVGLPLLLSATASARTLLVQALAAAALPVVALTLWLTTSSLSVPVAAVALLTFVLLAPDRIPKLGTLVVAGLGSAMLFAANEQRDALDRGLPTPAAQHQGDELLVIILVVCAGVALVQTGIGLALRYGERPRWLQISRERARVAFVAALASLVAIAVAVGLIGGLNDRWERFKGREGGSPTDQSRVNQLLDFSGSGRYQFWQGAVDANRTDPWVGIGPGTFEFWWSRNGTQAGFIRDAHSLYLETLGELGIVGLLLIGSFVFGVLGLGVVRSLRAPPELRLGLAAATAGAAAFAVSAGVDWDWELGVLPAVFLILASVAVAGGGSDRKRSSRRSNPRSERIRIAVVIALAVAAIIVIALPMTAASTVAESRQSAQAGNLKAALSDARTAEAVQPYAATPHLQEALVLELQGRLDAAAVAARQATRDERTNWRTWVILSRLEARRGDAQAAVAAYRRARALDPRSSYFAR